MTITAYYAPSYITDTPELRAIYQAGHLLILAARGERAIADAYLFEQIAWDHEPRDGKCLHDGKAWPCAPVAAAYEHAKSVLANATPSNEPIAA